jgi:hypothetical protein
MGIGRKMGKETQEKLAIGLVLLIMVSLTIFFFQQWRRKQKEAEPLLF